MKCLWISLNKHWNYGAINAMYLNSDNLALYVTFAIFTVASIIEPKITFEY